MLIRFSLRRLVVIVALLGLLVVVGPRVYDYVDALQISMSGFKNGSEAEWRQAFIKFVAEQTKSTTQKIDSHILQFKKAANGNLKIKVMAVRNPDIDRHKWELLMCEFHWRYVVEEKEKQFIESLNVNQK